jgi:hypothetical protein
MLEAMLAARAWAVFPCAIIMSRLLDLLYLTATWLPAILLRTLRA